MKSFIFLQRRINSFQYLIGSQWKEHTLTKVFCFTFFFTIFICDEIKIQTQIWGLPKKRLRLINVKIVAKSINYVRNLCCRKHYVLLKYFLIVWICLQDVNKKWKTFMEYCYGF